MTSEGTERAAVLLRRGYVLESITLGWNVVGVVILAVAAVRARSVALGGFGLDSLIEIGASTAVIWELSGTGEDRQRRALRLIGYAFQLLAGYLVVQSLIVLAAGIIPHPSPLGIAWTGITALVMSILAAGKARVGTALGNPVLQTEGKRRGASSGGAYPLRAGAASWAAYRSITCIWASVWWPLSAG